MSARVAIVDDHHLFRAGLAELLGGMPGVTLVGEAATATDAAELASAARPDVVLLDVELSGEPAATTIRMITESSPTTKIVMLTMHDDAGIVTELVAAGASGYLLKSAGRWELLAAIEATQRSEDTVVVSVSRGTLLAMQGAAHGPSADVLTAREIEVVRRLAQGGSNRALAADLFISEATVKRHLGNVYAKLGATSRLDAVRKAARLGLVADPLA